jgi:nicotinate phosphoribosyltransferase
MNTSRVNVSPLLTDLYQLTMLQAYFDRGMQDQAVFEFFVRRIPAERNFRVAAGLEQLVGDLDAMPEGTVYSPSEPVVRVTAPLPDAQLIESRLVNILHSQSLIASKAARCILAAAGKSLIDFGMHRAHGSEAAILAARASYLVGFAGTATVLAHPEFGIPNEDGRRTRRGSGAATGARQH